MAAGSIVIDLLMRTGSFETDSKRAEKRLQAFEASIKKTAVAFAAIGVASVTALTVMVKKSIDSMDAMSKMAQQAGVSVEALSSLSYAADLSGVSAEQFTTTLGRLTKGMAEAASGTGEAKKAFDLLSIGSSSLQSADEALLAIADKFAMMDDGAQKTSLALQLFGRAGMQMIPFLNMGRDGIAQLQAEADRLGVTLNTKTARAAEEFNDNLTRLGAISTGLFNQLAQGLLPVLTDITGQMFNAAVETDETNKAANDLGKNQLPEWVRGLTIAFAALADGVIFVVKSISLVDRFFDGMGKKFDVIGAKAERFALSLKTPLLGDTPKYLQDQIDAVDSQIFSLQMTALNAHNEVSKLFSDATTMSYLDIARKSFDGGSVDTTPFTPRGGGAGQMLTAGGSNKEADKLKEMLATVKLISGEFDREQEHSLEMLRIRDAMVGMTEDQRRVQEVINNVLDETSNKLEEIAKQRLDAANAGANDNVLSQFDAQAEAVRKLGEEYVELARVQEASAIAAQRTFSFGWNVALNQYAEDATNAATVAKSTFDSLTGNLSSAINTFVDTGKLSFSDFANSVIKDIIKIQLQAQVSQIFSQIASIVGGAISGSFGGTVASGGAVGGDVGSYSTFAEGGYTGMGGKYEPAGVVHRGEFVVNANATKKLGVGFLDRLNQGYANGGYVGSASSAMASSVNVNIKNEAGGDGYKASATVNRNESGLNVDVIVRKVIANDLRNNGQIAQQMGSTFGLRRTV